MIHLKIYRKKYSLKIFLMNYRQFKINLIFSSVFSLPQTKVIKKKKAAK